MESQNLVELKAVWTCRQVHRERQESWRLGNGWVL